MEQQNMGPGGSQPSGGSSAVKWVVGIVIVVVVIWALVAAQKKKTSPTSETNQVAGDSYKIGVILPLTGDAAAYGEPARNVMTMAVDEINSSGGPNGKKLELVFEDGKCNGKDATSAAQKLVNVDKVQAIVGGFCSGESLAAEKVAEQGKVVMVSPGSTSPKLTGSSAYFFRNIPSDDSQTAVDAKTASDLGYKTIAFMQEQTDYATALYQAFENKFTQLGGKTVVEAFPSDTTDFKTRLAKLRAQNPDALFIDTQTSANTEKILKQMKDLGWKTQLFINEASAGDTQLLAANKEQLEGALGAEFRIADNSKKQHVLDAYKQKYGKDLEFQSFGLTEYDTVYMYKDGIAAVGYDGAKLAEWSRTIKDWDGASGKITIKPDGDRESGYSPEVVKDGKMETYTK